MKYKHLKIIFKFLTYFPGVEVGVYNLWHHVDDVTFLIQDGDAHS